MASRRRRKEISCAARPGLVGEDERICEMWTGRPVRVERTRRCARELWPVKRRNSGADAVMVSLLSLVSLVSLVSLDVFASSCRGFIPPFLCHFSAADAPRR